MKTIKFLSYSLFVLFLSISITSCNGDDGADGADGATGPAGADGNANVIVKTFTPDPGPYLNWTTGSYLGHDASVFEIVDTDITQDVVDNAMIVVYFQLFEEDIWYPELDYINGTTNQVIVTTHSLNNVTIYAYDTSGALNAALSKVKYFIIPASNMATRTASQIDFNDYYAVCEYYGINPK